MDVEIKPIDRIVGEAKMPGDKSISHRSVIIGSIAKAKTVAKNFLSGDDCMRSVEAFKKMGVDINIAGDKLTIKGVGLNGLEKPDAELYLGNSGTTMRLLAGILSGQNFETVLTGDESLTKRPMKRIIEPLKKMGAELSSTKNNGCPPLMIKGSKLRGIAYKTPIASAQVKSCILLAGLYANGKTQVEEPFQSRDHTERMLKLFGAQIESRKRITQILPGQPLLGKEIIIPGDISSAVFFIVLGLILSGSKIKIVDVGINPTRSAIIEVLKRMGADIRIDRRTDAFEPMCDLTVSSSSLKPTIVTEEEVPEIIDEIPALCVAAAYADGVTEIRGAGELRVKETDRISSMLENLRQLGVSISVKGITILIEGKRKRISPAKKATGSIILNSFGDHRTAMAMCVAAASSDSICKIEDVACINTSFPGFFDVFHYLKK